MTVAGVAVVTLASCFDGGAPPARVARVPPDRLAGAGLRRPAQRTLLGATPEGGTRSLAWSRWRSRSTGCRRRAAACAATPRRPTSRTASIEKASSTRSSAPTLSSDWGCFDGAQAPSLATIVLHHDAAVCSRNAFGDIVGAAADHLDDIRAVASGGHYLGRHSTREHARDAWQPAVLAAVRSRRRRRTLVQDALERARELLATHEVLPLPDDVERHIDEVVAAHRRLAAGTV